MTQPAKTSDTKRFYGLMWVAIALALLFILVAGTPPQGSFHTAMWIWIAFNAFRGEILVAKWTIGFLTILAVIGLTVRLTVNEFTFAFIWPSLSKEAALLSSAITVLIYGSVFIYARYLERQATYMRTNEERDPVSYSARSDRIITGSGRRSKIEKTHPGGTHENSLRKQAGEYPDGTTSHTKSKSYQTRPSEKSDTFASLDASETWGTATAYFPNLRTLHERLEEIDSRLAERFKSDRIRLKDFANAQHEYWALLNELAQEVCGSGISEARNFLMTSINNGEYETVRRFIALGRTLGAGNMTDAVLGKFKASVAGDSDDTTPDLEMKWQDASRHYPQIVTYYDKLRKISPKWADKYRNNLVATRHFNAAKDAYEAIIFEIVNEHCRGDNWQPREYLHKVIVGGKSDIARRFIKFAKETGPQNMDNAALNRFRRSIDPLWDRDDG